MTIRKISGATSSIISKAELVVGTPGIFKASVTRNQLLATVQTEVDIIKSALISPRSIDHLLYDDEGSSRFLREFVLVGEQIGLGQFKQFNELVTMLDAFDLVRLYYGLSPRESFVAIDSDEFIYSMDKRLADNFNATEAISKTLATALYDTLLPFNDQTLILQGKGLNDAVNAQDQKPIFGYGFTYRDTYAADDALFKYLDKYNADSFSIVDSRVIFDTVKYLADAVGTLDLANIFDGITYNAILNRQDTASMYEYIAFAITSYRPYVDDLVITDPVSLQPQLPRAEVLLATDISNKQIVLNRLEELNSADRLTFSIANNYFDPVDSQDTTAFNFDLLLINRDPLLVSVTDKSQLQVGLERAENILALETTRYFDIAKSFADAFTPISLAAVSDGNIFLFNHFTNDTVTLTDILLNIAIVANRQFNDSFNIDDTKAFLLDKGLFDQATAQEQRAFDIAKVTSPEYQEIVEAKYLELALPRTDSQDIFDVGTQLYTFKDIFNAADITEEKRFVIDKLNQDSAEAIEYLARSFAAVRGERDGFVETFLANDSPSLEPGKYNYEDLVYQDLFSRVFLSDRPQFEETQAVDQIFKLEQRRPAHAIVAADLGYVFNIVKGFNDPVNMLDLTGTFDGSKYTINMDKTEDQPVYEQWRPKWRIRRRGRDGFLEEVPILDQFSINRLAEVDPLANYVYVHGDGGFRNIPSGGTRFYNGVNGELFSFSVPPEWTIFNILLGKFEDQPVPDVFKRVVTFIRNPHHNDLIGGGSDGFANAQPMTDVSANSPYPARFFSTNIPSPTKGDTSVTAVVVGGTSSIATNYILWSNFQYRIQNSVIASDGYFAFYGEEFVSPNLGPDGTTSAARITATGGTVRVGIELTSNATTYGNIFGGTNSGSVTLLNIQPGKEYYFNLKVKSNIASDVSVRLYADVNGGTVNWTAFTSAYTVTNSAWSDLRLAFTPLTSTGIRVAVGGFLSGGSILAAAASVSEIATSPYVRTNGWQVGQNPRNIDPAEKVSYLYSLDAKASTSYTVTTKQVDFVLGTAKKIINPTLQNSSLAVSYQPRDRDFVGVYDNSPNYVYAAARPTNDFFVIGADRGLRYQSSENTSETVKFTITKLTGDSTSITTVTSVSGNAVFGTSDHLKAPNTGTSSALVFPGDFTVEGWYYTSAINGDHVLFELGTDTSAGYVVTNSYANLYGELIGGTVYNWGSFPINTWNHVAIVRSGTTITCYFNGVANSSTDTQAGIIGTGVIRIGARFSGPSTNFWNGRITNFRVSNAAIYTSNFTPPTAQLTATSSTQLLLLTASAATLANDSSQNNFTVFNSGVTYATSPAAPITSSNVIQSYSNTHPVIIGRGTTSAAYPERRSGDSLDNPAFTVNLRAKPRVLVAVSSETVQAMSSSEGIFVGQRSWMGNAGGFRNAGDSQERIFFLLYKDNSNRDLIAIGLSSTATGIRTQPTESSLENIRFTTVKAPGLQGAYDTSVVTVGNWQTTGNRTVSTSEVVSFVITKDRLDKDVPGTTGSVVTAGRNSSIASVAYPERRSGDKLDNAAFDFYKTAFAGSSVTWTVQLNTIDPSPDIEYQASSVTLTYGPKDMDRVGTLDRFNLFYTVGRIFDQDSITIGGDTGFRYQPTQSSLEWTRFFFIKGLNDTVPMLDLADIFDGLNSFVTIFKTEATPIFDNSRFSPYPARFMTKDIGVGNHNGTNDIFYIGVSSTASGIRTQPTESSLENTYFYYVKNPNNGSTSIVTLGRGTNNEAFPERRSGDSLDNPAFIVNKLALQGIDYSWAFGTTTSRTTAARGDFAYAGDPSFNNRSRLSGSQFERIGFDYYKIAKAGISSSTTWSIQINTIDPNPDVEYQASSLTLSYGSMDFDAIGSLDRFFLTLATRRTFDLDSITVGLSSTLTGIRYQPTESNIENTFFTITKDRLDKDVPGTTGSVVTMGRGTSSVAYPERRSGDTLDNPAFDFYKTAQIRGNLPDLTEWTSQFSSITGLAITANRHTDTLDPVFVGSLGYRHAADILSNSSNTAVWVQQTQQSGYTQGTTYTLSGYMRLPAGLGLDNQFAFDVGTTSFSIQAATTSFTITNSWARYQLTFAAPRTSLTVRIRGLDTGGVDAVELFGFQINAGSAPTTYAKTTTAASGGNLLLQSEDFNSATWSKSSNTIVYANVTQAPTEFGVADWARPGDSQEEMYYLFAKIADTVDPAFVTIGVSSTTTGIRYQPSESSLENTKFTFVKAPGQNGVDDTSVVTVGNWQTQGDRTISTSELVTFNVTKLALQGVNNTWSGFVNNSSFTTTAAARGDLVYPGDPFRGVHPLRRSGNQAENVGFDVSLTAKRSVAGTLLLNTIDPTPDIEFQASSVTVAVNSWDLDAVGTLDRFNLFYQITRTFDQDFVTIGTDTGFRYQPTESSLENTKFFVIKGLADTVPMLDLTGIFDGLNSNITIQKQERTTIGFGSSIGVKVSGSQLERIPFDFFKTTGLGGAGSSNTVVTVGGDDGRRFQPSQSSLENTKFTFIKTPGTSFGYYDPTVAVIGFGDLVERPRVGSLPDLGFFGNGFFGEATKFDITTVIKQGVNNTLSGYINNSSFATTAGDRGERVYIGDPFRGVYPLRRSGNQAENVGFDFFKTAKAGSSVTWSIKINTIDSDPDFEWRDSSVTQVYGPSDVDAIGIWDRWWMAFGASRSPIDNVTIGGDTGFRYQPTESSLESTKFTITKSRFDFDVPGTTGAIVTLLDDLTVAPGRGLFDRIIIGFGSSTGIKVAGSLLERIPFDFIKVTGIGGAGSSNTVAIIGSGEDRRSASTERTAFAISKSRFDFDAPDWYDGTPGTTGAIVRIDTNDAFLTFSLDAKQSIDTTITGFINASSVTNLARQRELIVMGDPFRGVHPLRRSGNQAENVSVQYTKDAKRGTSTTTTALLQFVDGNNGSVSAALVTYTSSDTDVVGVFSGIVDVRAFARQLPLYTRNSLGEVIDNQTGTTELVIPGDDSANSPYPAKRLNKRAYPDDDATTSHHLIYTAGDVRTIQFNLAAKRGAGGTLLLNTIDPNPDVEWQQSSIAVTQQTWSPDAVGTLDYFSIYYMLYRQFDDFIALGSGIDQRQTTTENIKFLITKLLGDTTTMLDLTEVYDGITYNSTLLKADTQVIGSGQTSQAFPARPKSGVNEIVAIDFFKDARYSGATVTLSANTVTTNSGDQLFVGQQAWQGNTGGFRNAGDRQERISFNLSSVIGFNKNNDTSDAVIGISNNLDGRWYDVEKAYFTVAKSRFDKDVPGTTGALVAMGRGTSSVAYPERRSGDQLDTVGFDYALSAKRATTAGTITVKTIDPVDGNGFQSSVTINYVGNGTNIRSAAPDAVGIVDFFAATAATGRSPVDSITIGSDTGFRYQPDESSLENTYFTIGKRATEYDGGTSFVIMGAGDNYGFRYQPTENSLENTYFNITKSRFDKDVAGTTGAIVRIGRANTSQTYPERRSGDSLDNPAFDVFKPDMMYLGHNAPLSEFSSPVPSQTGITVTAVRNDQLYTPVFVGSQGYYPVADILANSSTTSIWVQQTRQSGFTQGTTYNFSIYMRGPVASTGNITFDIGYTSLAVITTTTSFTVTNTWSRYNFNFVAPRSSLTVRIRTTNTTRRDSLEVFGAQINTGTSPAAYSKTSSTVNAVNFILSSEDFNSTDWSKSSNTIVYANVTRGPEELGTVDWARPGDGMEELYYTVGKQADQDGQGSSLAYVVMGAGDNYGFRYQASENTSETVKFTVTKSRFDKDVPGTTGAIVTVGGDRGLRYQPTESDLENVVFNFTKKANRGTSGVVTLNTIDSNPDIEFRVSSVTVTRGFWEPDEVGMLDAFNLFYQITRVFDQDSVTIGTDTGFRNQPSQSSLEWTKFLIGKRLGQDDGTTMLDLTEVYDGLVYNSTILKREALTIGRGTTSATFPERRSGDSLDNPAFAFFKEARYSGATVTLSANTVTTNSGDILFVGQQPWQGNTAIRNAGDRQERIFYTVGKFADSDNQGSSTAFVVVGAGDNYGFRYQSSENTSETVKFTVAKSRFDFDVPGTTGAIVIVGRESTSQTYPERRSGDSLDNPAFLFGMTANRGVSSLVTIKTIDPPSGDAGQSSTSVLYWPNDYDVVGAVDFMFVQMIGTGRSFLDSVLIGTDTGFRYQPSESSLENTKFTIGKRATEYDGGTSYAVIGYGDLTERPRTGDLFDTGSGLVGEATKFSITKSRVDSSAGTTGSVVTMGRGTSSVVYPERRGGDGLDNPAFAFSLDAKLTRFNTSVTYTVSSTTLTASDRDRVFVGQQPWQGNTAIRNAGDRQERIFYTIGKTADSDGLGSSTAYVVMGAGDNYGFRYQSSENTSETVKFTVAKSRFDFDVPGTTGAIVIMGRESTSQAYPERRSGDSLDNPVFNYTKTAKRGVAGNVTLNTIDPNPDVEFFVSSVTISRGDWQLDEVGMLDRFNLFYVITRSFDTDSITIGTDTGFRNQPSQSSLEWTKFTIGKRLGQDDGTTMLDLTEVYDGLLYNTTMLKQEALTAGRDDGQRDKPRGYPERRSGDNLDNPAFLFSLDAKVDRLTASYTVSGVTVLARDRDRLFVGQQSWQGNTGGRRNAGDSQERIAFVAGKSADADGQGSSLSFVTVGAGNNYGFRYQASENTSETVKFTVTKSRFDFDVPGTTGAVVTIDTDDANWVFTLDAKQGAGTTTTLSGTTVRARDRDRLFVGQQLWQGNQGKRVSGDVLESFVVNLYKPVTETSTTILDRPYLYNQRGTIYEETTILGERPGYMYMDFAAGAKLDSAEITDLLVINVVFPVRVFDFPGDLDLNGNINTVASYGNLRMTDYADIDYFDDDYVGEKRSFT